MEIANAEDTKNSKRMQLWFFFFVYLRDFFVIFVSSFCLPFYPQDFRIFPGCACLNRLDVQRQFQAGESLAHGFLDVVAQVVALLHSPVTGHQ